MPTTKNSVVLVVDCTMWVRILFPVYFFPSYETAEALVSCFCSTLKTCAIQKCINHATSVASGVLFFITTAPATQMSEHTEQQHPRHKRCKCTRTRAFPLGACLHKHSRLFLSSNNKLEKLTSFLFPGYRGFNALLFHVVWCQDCPGQKVRQARGGMVRAHQGAPRAANWVTGQGSEPVW